MRICDFCGHQSTEGINRFCLLHGNGNSFVQLAWDEKKDACDKCRETLKDHIKILIDSKVENMYSIETLENDRIERG